MEIKEFISSLEKKHFSLVVQNEKLVLKGNKNKLTKEMMDSIRGDYQIIDYIKKNKEEIISYILNAELSLPERKSKNIVSIYRLSGLQHGILFHALYDKTAGAFVEQLSCDLVGADVEIYKRSWDTILRNHTILRSSFNYDEFSIPVQCVYRAVQLPIEELDYSSLTVDEQVAAIRAYEQTDRVRGFDFKVPPLMRITLTRLNDNRYRMLLTYHAILLDGWSMQVLMEEFLRSYDLLSTGESIPPVAEDRYEDFIRYLESPDKANSEEYWRNYLKGVTESTLLPFTSSTADRNKGVGEYDTIKLRLGVDETSQIERFAQENRLTVNTIMQGAWSYLLHGYTCQKDIVYGIIVSGRPDDLPNVEQRVGMYVNTLVLRSEMREEQTISAWLQNIQAEQVASRQHQNTPLQEALRYTDVQGDLFDSLLVVENYPVSKAIGLKEWRLQVENVHINEQINYPLSIMIGIAGEITVNFNYNADVIQKQYVENISRHFKHILLQIAQRGNLIVGDLQLLPADELQQIERFNLTKRDYPEDNTLVDLFEKQVTQTPLTIAVVFEGKQLTYDELNKRSNQLAHFLISKGVRAETLVPLCIERSLEMIIAIWGILKAGAAYVPVDPEYPQERINYIIEDTGAKYLISSTIFLSKLAYFKKIAEIIDLETDWPLINVQKTDNPFRVAQPTNLAYVIYTSGSTGKPKGAMNEHRGIVNRLCWAQENYCLTKNDAVLQKTTFCFDVSVWELLWPSLIGAKLVFAKPNGHRDNEYLKSVINTEGITILHFVPSMLETFLADLQPLECAGLRKVLCSGDVLQPSQAMLFRKKLPLAELHNLYGPTEAAIDVTYWELPNDESEIRTIPIGKPVANTTIHILDKNKHFVPIGVGGEIFIAGVQVGRGYLNQEELTNQNFIANPLNAGSESKVYKTGDLGRWLADGNIEYLGRKDDQVKIRGYRIELGEIEVALEKSGLVNTQIVIARDDFNGNKQLSCYVVPAEGFTKDKAVAFLKTRLPEYMIPAFWVELDSLPTTAIGKVDRKALIAIRQISKPTYIAPRNELEIKLATAWRELLKIDKIGVNDNFFELGGHSLLAMRMLSWIRRELKAEIEIKELFENATVAALASRLADKSSDESLASIKAVHPRPEKIPLSFSQERLWFIDRLGGSLQYHLPVVLCLEGKLNVEALEFAMKTVVGRHEILRTVIRDTEGQGFQYVNSAEFWSLRKVDKAESIPDDVTIQSYIQDCISSAFDLSEDYMLRAELIRIKDDEHILVATLHHIASDGWSMPILVQEVVELYTAYTQLREPKLPPLPVQYADYALWQRGYLTGDFLEKKVSYWKKQLDNVTPLQLSSDYGRKPFQKINGVLAEFSVPLELVKQIRKLASTEDATLFMTLLAAFKVLLYRYTDQEDICVGTPVANRNHADIEGLIGFFVNTLALRTKVQGELTFPELLREVKSTTLEAYNHQDVPFEKIVEAVVKDRDTSRSPLFQVMFDFQNAPYVPTLSLGDLTLSSIKSAHNTTQFELSFTLKETSEGLRGSVEYNTELFNADMINGLINHFIILLNSIVTNLHSKIYSLQMLGPAEEHKLLNGFCATQARYATDKTIPELIEEQAVNSSDSVALVCEDKHISYKSLNERANQLAHFLREKGVVAGSIVPVCMECSVQMIIVFIAVLKAGAAYVPVDPEYPQDRINFMLKDIDAKLVICNTTLKAKLDIDASIVTIDTSAEQISIESKENLDLKPAYTDLAYVIYTSGSTGQPKGVMIEHKSLLNYVLTFKQYFSVSAADTVLQQSSISFDTMVEELYPALISGARVILVKGRGKDINAIKKYIEHDKVTLLSTTPTTLEWLNKENISSSYLRYIISGGEVLSAEYITNLFSKVQIVNSYGPTEATVCVTYNEVKELSTAHIIGSPLPNIRLYILDSYQNLVPIGAVGELYIAGVQVARGYFNRPELTEQKFVDDKFSSENGAQLYRTGDLARWRTDGNLEYLGRNDEQIKIRGIRIELGEVENAIRQSELVEQVVVLAKDSPQGKRLVAYFIPASTYDREVLGNQLRSMLPEYMLPSSWVEIESLPLTPNGKINRRYLSALEQEDISPVAYIAPRNELEQKLVLLWQELLNTERIGINDNFFELGGHSLLAMRLVSYMESKLQITVPIHILFQFSSISELSKYLEVQKNVDPPQETTSYKLIDV
ncbi:MAG: amino acid adenylation domain-containing protein [Pedobacter sp.]